MPRDVPRSRARWLAFSVALAFLGAPLVAPPSPSDWWAPLAAVCAALGGIGLWRGRVWGLYGHLGAAFVLVAAGPAAGWLATAAVAALPLAVHLPALVRADGAAALGLAGLVALGGLGAGGLAAWRPIPAAAHVVLSGRRPTAAPPAPVAPTRQVQLEVNAELLAGVRELRVTFRNSGAAPLEVDLPIPRDDPRPYHAPLFDPLVRVEAWSAEGRPLESIRSFGCGAVYVDDKVELTRLAPGAAQAYRVDLPDAWYPQGSVLPSYSHFMLMNARELVAAPRAVATRRVMLRVVYDSAALAGSWRDDLATGAMPPGLRVRGQSAGVHAEGLPVDRMMPRDWKAVAEWARVQ